MLDSASKSLGITKVKYIEVYSETDPPTVSKCIKTVCRTREDGLVGNTEGKRTRAQIPSTT